MTTPDKSQIQRDEKTAYELQDFWLRRSARHPDMPVYVEGVLDGLAHCRETEVKELDTELRILAAAYGSSYSTPSGERILRLQRDNYRLEEQLRVAVEALKDVDKWVLPVGAREDGMHDGHRNFIKTTISDSLQKIEAMKGGGDDKA